MGGKKKKGGKKGKKGKVEYLVTPEALAPFEVNARDIIATPLGVECTVLGVRDGSLWLQWPGGLVSPAGSNPAQVHDKQALEINGYSRRPQSAMIQRTIDERENALFQNRRYGVPLPKTAKMNLPLGPHGIAGSARFAAYQQELLAPGSCVRPASAPAKAGKKK